MDTLHWPEPSGQHDSERVRNWIPFLVPGTAAVITALIFLGAWLVLSRP